MPSKPVEHFCTLFDSKFLPFGLTLRRSLEKQAGDYILWILCMDDKAEADLSRLALPRVELISLHEVEDQDLLRVKPGRSPGEYCWTLTPFIFNAIFNRAPEVTRITYLDADLLFFDSPALLLSELDGNGKTVLITEHAYDPRYDLSKDYGRFCVQFITFGRDEGSQLVNRWWRERCLEWCFSRQEDGKFGDQKYLDSWPERFADTVHVLRQTSKTLGPWNVQFAFKTHGEWLKPVFFHYHGFRPVRSDKVHLHGAYQIGRAGNRLYDVYLKEFSLSCNWLLSHGIEPYIFPMSWPHLEFARDWVRKFFRQDRRYNTLPAL